MTARPTYTYAIAWAFDPGLIAGLSGVDGAPVHLVRHEDVVAVCSPLAPDWFDEDTRQARLHSLEAVETLARAHHAVVATVAGTGVVLPLRLMTIHDGDAGVAAMLHREHDRLRRDLDRLAGRVELGVKVYAGGVAPAGPPSASATPGRDYLRQRRAERNQRDHTRHAAAGAADRVEAALAALAVDRRRHRPQPAPLSGVPEDNVLNAAYLVERDRVSEFALLASRLAAHETAVRVDVTGPWAPYSFVDATGDGAP
jgi:hypothetical protein